LHIKRFTTAATQLLNLRPSDIGCPISHVAGNVVNVDLSRDARAVLTSQRPITKEVKTQAGHVDLNR
jgi:two-component system CheB/CheR fusion protein